MLSGPFWIYARKMLRYRVRLAIAIVLAGVSAAGLGVGLVAMVGILRNILGEEGARDLPMMASDLNASEIVGGRIPQAWIDALPSGAYPAVLWTVIGLGVLTVVGAAANFGHQYLSLSVSAMTVGDIRRRLFAHVLRFPLSTVIRSSASESASRIINDTGKLNFGFQALTSKAVAQVTKGAAALGAAFLINWRLSLVTLVVAPVLYTIIRKLGKRVRRASRGAMQSQARLLSVVSEVLGAFRVVKVFTAERRESGRFARHNRDVVREQLRVRTAKALASPLIETTAIFVLGILAIVAAKAILDGKLSASSFMLTLGSLAAAGQALRPLTGIVQDIQVGEAAASRLQELMNTPTERPAGTGRAARLARHTESIVFEGVRFTYPGATEPTINGVDLSIRQGETVAFVGPNGSGKTTLLSLVPRLFEVDEGRVLIDGADIARVSLRSLRRQIGVVTQETVLFRGTIAQNIAYGRPGATREQIEDAARRAHAHAFIIEQPAGYETVVGDQGLTLSGGQRQRVAIARAILRDPAILIMDEATSMIDAESEAQINEALQEFGTGRTCLIVAHRLSTVLGADRIVVLDAGRVVDTGDHASLLERCPVYRQIAGHQLHGAPGEGG